MIWIIRQNITITSSAEPLQNINITLLLAPGSVSTLLIFICETEAVIKPDLGFLLFLHFLSVNQTKQVRLVHLTDQIDLYI